MSQSPLQTLAKDLLNIEVNTILKADMSGCKMPSSHRQVLYSIATKYHDKLVELGFRGQSVWPYAGLMSFLELYEAAQNGIRATEAKLKNRDEQNKIQLNLLDLKEQQMMLSRIHLQTGQIIGLFLQLASEYERKQGRQKKFELDELTKEIRQRVAKRLNIELHNGYFPEHFPQTIELLENETENERWLRISKALEDEESLAWNNDFRRITLHQITDLELTPDQNNMLRKVWEIGTERVILQTVVQADGDVTTRISERFAANFDQTLHSIHNQSVSTSVSFWSNLVKTVADLVSYLFGNKPSS